MQRFPALPQAAVLASALALAGGRAGAAGLADTDEQRLWVHRGLGAAYLRADAPQEAAAELALAMQLAPASAGDARNAGVAALRAGDLGGARIALEVARGLDATSAATAYALALVEERSGHPDAALERLRECRRLGGEGPELRWGLGQLLARAGALEEAEAELRALVELGPEGAPRHYAAALRRWARTLRQLGRGDAAADALRRWRALARTNRADEPPEEQLELGPLLDPARFPPPADLRAAGPLPAFRVEPLPGADGQRWADARDLDGDGDVDLLVGNGQTLRDLRRGDGGWTDVTDSRGLAGLLGVTMARALDMDDDGQPDLVRAGGGGLHVHFGIEGAWDPPKRIFGRVVTAFAPVDFDHEGDVDLVGVGAGGVVLIRNDGGRAFTDVTASSGLDAVGPAVRVEPGDLDGDDAVDLALVTRGGGVVVAWGRGAGGRFDVDPLLAALPAGAFDLAVGDLDADGRMDLAAAAPGGVFVARNDGGRQFSVASEEPALAESVVWPPSGGRSLWIRDLDDDGRLDLLGAADRGARLGLNAGGLTFLDAPEAVRPLNDAGVRPVAVALLDADERLDLVTSDNGTGVARNVGPTGRAVVVRPRGVAAARDGVGAVVEVRAGAVYARAGADGGPVHLGVGTEAVDALRVRWPDGVWQTVPDASVGGVLEVTEQPPPDGTGPFLFAWDGAAFRFVPGDAPLAPLGWPAVGSAAPAERGGGIRLAAGRLQPDSSGWLTVQITEERREVTYLDRLRLVVVDHPRGMEVVADGGRRAPESAGPLRVRLLGSVRPPVRATDHRSRDVTERLLFADDIVVGDLPETRWAGFTHGQDLTLDFGDVAPGEPVTLHLTGRTRRPGASAQVAATQSGRFAAEPPHVDVRRPDGTWEPWPDPPGLPDGPGAPVAVDLTGAFPSGRAVVRVSTNLHVLWDRARLEVGLAGAVPAATSLPPDSADVHFRGFSEPVLAPVSGPRLDHGRLRPGPPGWNPPAGTYTRHGDVMSLLEESDDRYVVMASGDECTVRWRADRLPAPAPGRERTYFLTLDGWAKDGSPNTAESATVTPWPFHAMSAYPPPPDERYPPDALHVAYLTEWNTRPAPRLTPDLAAKAASAPRAETAAVSAEESP